MQSLQERCLDIVATNFDRFHSVYITTTNPVTKLKFEFLRRKYSDELLEELYSKDQLREKYIDFLFNERIKFLQTEYLSDFKWEVVHKKFSEIGATIENILFDNDRSESWEEVICYLPNLLLADFWKCTDELLVSIGKFCPKIQCIDLYHSSVSSLGLKIFCLQGDFAHLREITLNYRGKTVEDIAYVLKNLPMLEKFECKLVPHALCSIHENDTNAMNSVKPLNLTKLDLLDLVAGYAVPNNILQICVSMCPYLKSLACSVFTEEDLNLCSTLSKLQKLHLENLGEDVLEIDSLLKSNGNMLTSLIIINVSFETTNLLTNCYQLNSLEMDSCDLHCNEKKADMLIIHNLKKMSIVNSLACSAKEAADFLQSFPNLESLGICNFMCFDHKIEDRILKVCNALKLKELDFSGSNPSFEFIQDVMLTCTSLTSIDLEGSELSHSEELINRLIEISKTLPERPYIRYWSFRNFNSDSDDSEVGDFED